MVQSKHFECVFMENKLSIMYGMKPTVPTHGLIIIDGGLCGKCIVLVLVSFRLFTCETTTKQTISEFPSCHLLINGLSSPCVYKFADIDKFYTKDFLF